MSKYFHFEKRGEPLAPKSRFRSRLLRNLQAGALTIAAALAIGMAGYGYFAHMGAVDAFLNSAMILSGMGPVGDLPTDASKIFAGVYAIFCGLLIFAVAGLILAPVLHRVLHRFHVEDDEPGSGGSR
jgi:sterol desaturase/sphingolipid hydroxylase (fatty acid hydroxylase superfamily)